MPFQPFPTLNTFQLPDGSFLYDDSQVDYPALEQQRETDRALRALEAQYGLETVDSGGPPLPGPGGGSGGPEPGPDPHNNKDYPTNSLWLDILSVSNNSANLLLHGTVPDVVYDLWTRQALTDSVWLAESWVVGAAETNVTPASIPVGSRTNALFVWARSWGDEDGNGLPDWWELQYFATNGVDPYASLAADGWTTLDKYQRGWIPTNFYTPPPPRNVLASLQGTGPTVRLAWESGGGPVTNYIVRSGPYGWQSLWTDLATISPETLSLTNVPDFDFYGYDEGLEPGYVVRACFANGAYADSAQVPVHAASLGLKIHLVRGPSGRAFLAMQSPPPTLEKVRLSWFDGNLWEGAWADIYATNLVNGTVDVSGYPFVQIQAITSDGRFSNHAYPLYYGAEDRGYQSYAYYPKDVFVDAQLQLKENLKFLLASATISHPFSYASGYSPDALHYSYPAPSQVWSPQDHLARPETSPEYEYYGFHFFSSNLNFSVLQPVRPIQENYLWRNFLFDPLDFGPNGWTNAIDFDYEVFRSVGADDEAHYCLPGLTTNSAPLALQLTNAAGVYAGHTGSGGPGERFDPADLGLILDGTNGLRMLSNLTNVYGLPLLSAIAADGTFKNLLPGDPATPIGSWAEYFIAVEPPNLETVGYYFVSQTPYFRYGATRPPLPGSPEFSVTSTSPLLIAPFAEPYTVSCWAKQRILNGDPGKFAFLEQYFEKAYRIDATGAVTTNEAGLLSPYGEFFPTHPGPAALVTMPDIDTGQRATGLVHVIKLQLDVNHDGAMDTSFAGADNTSPERPYVFWVNNDCDSNDAGHNPPGQESQAGNFAPFEDDTTDRINSWRDLEDYARLWICGVPALTNAGYQVTLSWASVSSGNPGVKLFQSVEPDGGTRYLTDTNIAASQSGLPINSNNFCYAFATVTNGQTFTFPANLFTNEANKHFLFEGVSIGSGQLVLTISQNGQTIAQTGAWLDLHDIKDFYERAVITNNTSGAISNWTSGIEVVQYPVVTDPNADTNLIVYVHGGANDVTSWLMRSDTLFKRLYWAGYRGKVATVRWPSPPKSGLATDPLGWFNKSELNAYKAASSLKAYLNQLRQRFPNYRLNIMPQSLGGAVVSEALSEGAPFDTLILCQISMAASSYDINAPTNAALLALEVGTAITPDWQPMGYHGAYTNLTTGRVASYYNTNDDFLNLWTLNQESTKPPTSWYSYDGTNCWYTDFLFRRTLVTDPQESRAMLARSRTLAIGEQPPAAGQVNQGVISSTVDLRTQFGIGNSPDEHSAFFTRPLQRIWPLYDQILEDCLIQRIRRQ